jgi:hypothetical protein
LRFPPPFSKLSVDSFRNVSSPVYFEMHSKFGLVLKKIPT